MSKFNKHRMEAKGAQKSRRPFGLQRVCRQQTVCVPGYANADLGSHSPAVPPLEAPAPAPMRNAKYTRLTLET